MGTGWPGDPGPRPDSGCRWAPVLRRPKPARNTGTGPRDRRNRRNPQPAPGPPLPPCGRGGLYILGQRHFLLIFEVGHPGVQAMDRSTDMMRMLCGRFALRCPLCTPSRFLPYSTDCTTAQVPPERPSRCRL
jgi:hypothetical protein